jgi:hypothetical protein
MNKILIYSVLGLFMVISPATYAEDANISGLYGSWCLIGMATEIDGEKIPDKASYTFTKDNILKYDAGFFKQEDSFTIETKKIKTKSMGNYKIISIKKNEMVLNYGGFMFFTKGMCQ